MTKEEYLKKLEASLRKYMTKAEVDDILMDYGEFFEDGRRQKQSDTEISAKLGDPEIIAQQFLEELPDDRKKKTTGEIEKIKESTSSAIKGAASKIGSEFEKIKGKAALSADDTLTEKGRKESFISRLFKGIFNFAESAVKFIIKAAGMALLIIAGCFAALAAAFCIGALGSLAVFLIVSGIAGIIGSAAFLSFISAYFTVAGIFASAAALSLGLLLVLAFVFIVHSMVLFIKKRFFKSIKAEEAEANA